MNYHTASEYELKIYFNCHKASACGLNKLPQGISLKIKDLFQLPQGFSLWIK